VKNILLLLSLIFTLQLVNAKSTKQKEIVLTDDNVISLRSDFNSESVGKLIEEADKLNSRLPSGEPIYLFLRTPGGSIQAGLELFEYLKGLNRPVHTITLFAASMGFQTVQQLGKRYILKYGVLMSHRASGGFQAEFGGGISQMDTRYGLWLRRVQILDKDTVARTNGKQTLKSYQDSYASELWLNGQEAVDQGYADEVVTVKCDASLESKTENSTINAMFFSVDVSMSKCPLKTKPLSVKANIKTNIGKISFNEFVAKNPTFKSCESIQQENNSSFSMVPKEVVCATDPTLSRKKITNVMKKASEMFFKDLTNSVIFN
jgi:ATP-dependent Clp protease, protease subunit